MRKSFRNRALNRCSLTGQKMRGSWTYCGVSFLVWLVRMVPRVREHLEGGVCRSLSRCGLVEAGSASESGARVWAAAWRGCWCGKFGRPRIQEDIAVPDFREKVAQKSYPCVMNCLTSLVDFRSAFELGFQVRCWRQE